jgi:NAD+ synthase (glutamine-hydrolysing)
VKISLAQLNYHTGNFESNTSKIILAIEKAKSENCDLVIFAELSTCGYPPRDLLEFNDFILKAESSIQLIAEHCIDIAAVVGSPSRNPKKEGKDLFNSAYFLYDGKIQSIINKSLLPTYDIFDEYRHFESNKDFNIVEYKSKRIAITVCEDLWNIDENPMYQGTPMDELILQKPDFIINVAASPFSQTQIKKRQEILSENASKYELPLFYVNHVGAQTHLIFDGGSCVLQADGKIFDELNYFEEDQRNFDLEIVNSKLTNKNSPDKNKYEFIENALVLGIKQYFQKLGFSKAIIGLSGGIDSALVTYLATKALGKENVLAVLLPSRYSSEHSIKDSIDLVNNLGINHHIISIEDTVNSIEHSLSPYFNDTKIGIAEENIQSRSRAIMLMAISNKFGYILLNTSNKSELAVGYGTLYGDMCGGLSVIGDLYKTEVFELCNFINRNEVIIPVNILTKEPSAELRPDQKDSDSLPPYEILDQILFSFIEENKGKDEIISKGFDSDLVKRILRMVNMNEWKRWQAPPILRISQKSFGPGRRIPISGYYS